MAFDMKFVESFENLANSEADIQTRVTYLDPGSSPFKTFAGGPFADGGGRYLQDGWSAYWYNIEFSEFGETTVFASYWVHFPDSAHGVQLKFFEGRGKDLGVVVHSRIDITGVLIEAFRGDGTTSLGTSDFPTPQSVWMHVEVKLVMSDTVGSVEVRINGKVALNLSGLDTINDVGGVITGMQFLGHSTNGIDQSWTHIVIQGTSGDWLGFHRTFAYQPNADGAETDWTPVGSTGNYEAVDDTNVDDDTTYITASTSGNRDRLGFVSPSFNGEAAGIVVKAAAKKTDIGQTTLKIGIRGEAGTEDLSATLPIEPNAYRQIQHIVHVNPEDGLAWEETDLDGAEIVLELT